MKCNIGESKLLDYYYKELSGAERAEYEKHLESCAACREALDELQVTSKALHTWDVPDPQMNIVFVSEKASLLDRIKESLTSFDFIKRHPALSFGYAMAALFLILSAANFNASYNRETGTFSISTSLFGQSEQEQSVNYELVTQQILQSQQNMLEMVDQVIRERETNQQELFSSALISLTSNWQRQRDYDLENLSKYMYQLQESTDQGINNTRSMILEFARTAGIEIKK